MTQCLNFSLITGSKSEVPCGQYHKVDEFSELRPSLDRTKSQPGTIFLPEEVRNVLSQMQPDTN